MLVLVMSPMQYRNEQIAQAYTSGMTLKEVGERFGLTRQRVKQILSPMGFGKLDGGKAVKSLIAIRDKSDRKSRALHKLEAKCLSKWGMSCDQYHSHVAEFGSSSSRTSPMRRFITQRSNARTRGVEWQFNFVDWFRVWQESGRWDERGRGFGYVMARYGDTGAYCEANVYICTQSQNASDSFVVSSVESRAAKRTDAGHTARGRGKGWSYQPHQSKKNPYVVQSCSKYVGSFPTEEAARAAYLAACALSPSPATGA